MASGQRADARVQRGGRGIVAGGYANIKEGKRDTTNGASTKWLVALDGNLREGRRHTWLIRRGGTETFSVPAPWFAAGSVRWWRGEGLCRKRLFAPSGACFCSASTRQLSAVRLLSCALRGFRESNRSVFGMRWVAGHGLGRTRWPQPRLVSNW